MPEYINFLYWPFDQKRETKCLTNIRIRLAYFKYQERKYEFTSPHVRKESYCFGWMCYNNGSKVPQKLLFPKCCLALLHLHSIVMYYFCANYSLCCLFIIIFMFISFSNIYILMIYLNFYFTFQFLQIDQLSEFLFHFQRRPEL